MPRAKKGPHESYVWAKRGDRPPRRKPKEKPLTVDERRALTKKWLEANHPKLMRGHE